MSSQNTCQEVRWKKEGEHLLIQCVTEDGVKDVAKDVPILYENHLWGCNILPDKGSCMDGLSGKVKLICGQVFGRENACGICPLPPEEGGRQVKPQ
jgi:hypothetical protein